MLATAIDESWYVVRTIPSREFVAAGDLRRLKQDYYLPKIWNSKRKRQEPLFGPYLFVRMTQFGFALLRLARGIIGIVMGASEPAKVPDEFISSLRGAENENGIIKFKQDDPFAWRNGDQVRIDDYVGTFEKMTSSQRASVLLNMLGSKRSVQVDVRRLKAL